MAVAKKQQGRQPKEYKLMLEGDRPLNVSAIKGGRTVGDERELGNVLTEFQVFSDRLQYKKKLAVEAVDDQQYRKALAELQRYQGKLRLMEPKIDAALLLVLTDWDMALSEEDEANGVYVPLTEEGMKTVEMDEKADVFGKLWAKFGEEDEEKKEQFENSRDGIAVTASLENVRPDSLTTS